MSVTALRTHAGALSVLRQAASLLLDPSTRNGVGAKMGLDATKPLDAEEMKRIRVPGEDEVDLAKVVSAAPSAAWRKAIA
jgi:2,5-furandicarboxylate decarboxylase 1